MCYNIALNKKGQELEKRFKATLDGEFPYLPYDKLNAFQKKPYPIVTVQGIIREAYWGLIPFWQKDPKKAEALSKSTKNARFETLSQKSSFRDAYKTGRVLVPVTGFFEWENTMGGKVPYRIGWEDQRLYALGGLMTYYEPFNQYTFTVITQPSEGAMAQIHDRMPLIIKPSLEEQWLKVGFSFEENPCSLFELDTQKAVEFMKEKKPPHREAGQLDLWTREE